MDFKNFSSDSTYCSLYENRKQSQIRRRKATTLTDSKFLDKVHKEVIFHLEGKKLLGRVEVVQYIKRISKMKLKNPKDQCFADKIQSSLLKTYKLLKQFEESLSIGTVSPMLDTIENYSFAEDFQVLPVSNEDPKQILLRTTSVNNEESSFPLEMLTNNNFISSSEQNIIPQAAHSLTENEVVQNENNEKETSTDCFLSENSEKNRNYCSLSSVEAFISTDHHYLSNIYPISLNSEKIADSTNNCTNVSLKNLNGLENTQHCINSSSNNKQLSQGIAVTDKGTMENFTHAANNSEKCNIIKEISKMCSNLSINKYDTAVSEPANFEYEDASGKNLNLKSVTDLGNKFKESYNSRIYSLCLGTGKNLNKNQIWQQIEDNITNAEHVAEKVHRMLEELSKKLQLDDGDYEMQHTRKGVHNFSEEDNAKLDIEDLMNANTAKLEQISREFQSYFNTKHC